MDIKVVMSLYDELNEDEELHLFFKSKRDFIIRPSSKISRSGNYLQVELETEYFGRIINIIDLNEVERLKLKEVDKL